MAHVSVTINGRNYRMACDDGQETQLSELAREFDQRIANLRANFGEIGDMRLTVMAALTVADELRDARERLRAAAEEVSALQRAHATAADRADAAQAELATAFNSAAERVEEAARLLSKQDDDHMSAVG